MNRARSTVDAKPCAICSAPIKRSRRQRYCGKACRDEDLRAGSRRFAYADPPYPGTAYLYREHPDFGGEVDHPELIRRLDHDFPDGWALSTSAQALLAVWGLCPRARLCIWDKPFTPMKPTASVQFAYEPVLVCGGRPRAIEHGVVRDVVSVSPVPYKTVRGGGHWNEAAGVLPVAIPPVGCGAGRRARRPLPGVGHRRSRVGAVPASARVAICPGSQRPRGARCMSLELAPLTLREASEYVHRHHRHSGVPTGMKFAIGAAVGDELVGVAIVGRPVARSLDDGETLEVLRVCTTGARNACSFLYGRAWRAVRALGYRRLVTYTLRTESGASLRGAAFRIVGETRGREWSCLSRPRDPGDPQDRFRWEATPA